MTILIFNAGSSSLKFGVFSDSAADELASGLIDWKSESGKAAVSFRPAGGSEREQEAAVAGYADAVAHALRLVAEIGPIAEVRAVGHRVVHGGERFRASVRIDPDVRQAIGALSDLAPLHNPPALAGIDSAAAALPGVPQFAAFDTAFFAGQPPEQYLYPVPHAWYTDWGIRRFGFHGISHHYCTLRAAELLGRTDSRLVICHLGNGCSASAAHAGTGLACTMGFTPLEGLMMGTRSGSIDPAIVLHLLRRGLLTADQIDQALLHGSGLLGVSGTSADFRAVESAANGGDDRARLALRMYADRVRAAVGALSVGMGGIDALVFTAGVGEHSASLRGEVCRGLECLGLRLDPAANTGAHPDADVATRDSAGRILVMHTREELLIAREVQRLLGK